MSIRVMVSSNDPVLEVGIAAQLRGRREVQLVEGLDLDTSAVAIVAADELSEPTLRLVRAVQRDGCPRVVVIVARLDESGVLDAIEAGDDPLHPVDTDGDGVWDFLDMSDTGLYLPYIQRGE